MPHTLKSAAGAMFHHAGGLAAARWFHRRALRILMYHRFGDRAALGRQCAHIRRFYRPVSMGAVSEWLHEGRPLPPGALAVTVDDGYADFAGAAAVFSEYGIPVTVFLVTDFLDRKTWLWFDRVVYAFRCAKAVEPAIPLPDGTVLRFSLESADSRRAAGQQLADRAVFLTATERRCLIAELPDRLEAEIPEPVPAEYGPLSWDQVRRLAGSGIEFGAHTKTHPILSGLTDPGEMREEIAGSKARIEMQLDRPVLHFCYPNGKMRDIGPAASAAVRNAGMRTAVTAEPGLNHLGQDPYLLRRIGADPSHSDPYFARRLSGL